MANHLRLWKDGALVAESSVTISTTPTTRSFLVGSSTPPQHTNSKEEEARWLEDKIGHKLDMTRHYPGKGDWTGDGAGPSVQSGRIPVISFTSGGDNWNQVANGSMDAYIKTQVAALNQRGGLWLKAVVGFENEPEAETASKGTPAQYVAAYEHIIKVARAAGLKNDMYTFLMEFTWQNGSGRNPDSWVVPSAQLGVHGYSTRVGSCGEQGIRSFVQTFDAPHATATKYGKKLGGFEGGYATKAGTSPTIKGNFFRSIPATVAQLPRMGMYVYWNMSGGKCDLPYGFFLHSAGEKGDPMIGFGQAFKTPTGAMQMAAAPASHDTDWEPGDDTCPRCGAVMQKFSGIWRCENCRVKGRQPLVAETEIRDWRRSLS